MAYPDQDADYAAGSSCATCSSPHARPEFVSYINEEGYLENSSVIIKTILVDEKPYLEDQPFENIYGIVLHRTSGSTLEGAYEQAKKSRAGTHFYIDKDGAIYQAASLKNWTNHVGPLKSKCIQVHKKLFSATGWKCKPEDLKKRVK